MGIEKIRSLSVIKFPRSVDLKEAKGLLLYLAENLHAKINYRASYFMFLNECGKEDNRTADIKGTIFSSNGGSATMDSFHFEHSTDTSKLESIRFNFIPEWNLSDYSPNVKELWSNTRNLVKEYYERG